MLTTVSRRRFFAATSVVTFALSAGVWCGAQPPAPVTANLSVLIVGGGPNKKYNQVAIESNVRYVDSLLPKEAPRRVLFAGGNGQSMDILYHDAKPDTKQSDAEAAFDYLFGSRGDDADKYRAVKLRAINGPAVKENIAQEIARLGKSGNSKNPALLYFTGHGSPAKSGDLDNNVYDLWNNDRINVRELAGEIAKLPPQKPVVLVMVQCFGGAFGNVLFENGDPKAGQVERPIAGFFATTRERVAAGCTPEVNEADYHDFTSSFFAALSGKTRLGQTVPPPDYDKNGKVGMDEAFAYALITEPSVDVPVCTSDVFLRRFVPIKDDAEVAALPYSKVLGMASPAQKAALDGISKDLNATGETRLQDALADLRARAGGAVHFRNQNSLGRGSRENEVLNDQREKLRSRFPGLRNRASDGQFAEARRKALARLQANPSETKTVLAAGDTIGEAMEAGYADELRGARWLRLIRVAKTVVLENKLRKSGNAALIARFDALKALESGNPLMP